MQLEKTVDVKTIVIDARMILHSGIGTYIYYYIKGLIILNKYNIVLVGPKPILQKKFDVRKIHQIINTNLPIYSIYEQILMPLLIPKCDIFWSPHYNIPVIPIQAKKILVTIHDTYHLSYAAELSFFKKIYSKCMINFACKKADLILTVSNFSKFEILKYTKIDSEKISVLYNGVDFKQFGHIEKEANQLRLKSKLALPDNYILFVGNVKPNKNLLKLLEAFKQFLSINLKYSLVIVGKKDGFISGDEKVHEILKKDPLLNSYVIFTGYVESEDLPTIYQLASVFVFPSLYEGFGLPPLESMASGCPVIVSNSSCLPEICGESAAEYIIPEESESIVVALKNILFNKVHKEQLIAEGRRRAKQFTWDKSISSLIHLFDTL